VAERWGKTWMTIRARRSGGVRRVTVATALLLAALSVAAAPAGRQARSTAPPDADAEARAITQIVTAAEVAAWAREHRDVQAMLVAARMMDDVRTRQESGDAPFLTASTLLDEAEAMAGGDPTIRSEIMRLRTQDKGVRASPFGAGPIVLVRRVQARQTFGFEVEVRRNEVLRVAAIGDGDTNIDLVLRDRSGTIVCSDNSQDHYPVCTVARPQGGALRVEVVNHGGVWSRVQILTN
jgi:hypothetical protein